MIKWIKEVRSTERGRILFKFALYLLFLFFVLLLCIVAGSMEGPSHGTLRESGLNQENSDISKDTSESQNSLTYFEKQKLFEGKYEFTYEIQIGEEKINFIGEYDEGKVTGFKEDGTNLISYEIEDGVVYKKNLFEREEMVDLYVGLDETLFDIGALFATLNSLSATIVKDETDKVYSYEFDEYTYKVITDDECIKQIEIKNENVIYNFSFKF